MLAGSPSISGAVIRRHWLQIYIQFICLLVAYISLLAVAVLCLTPYALLSFLMSCSVGSAGLVPTACLLFLLPLVHCLFTILGSCIPFYAMTFAIYTGIAFLCFTCWDSMFGFALACWDSMSGFPGL